MLQDYAQLVKTHRELDADITISTYSVSAKVAAARGLVRVDPETGQCPSPLQTSSVAALRALPANRLHVTVFRYRLSWSCGLLAVMDFWRLLCTLACVVV